MRVSARVSAQHPLKPTLNPTLKRHTSSTSLIFCFRQSYRQSSRQNWVPSPPAFPITSRLHKCCCTNGARVVLYGVPNTHYRSSSWFTSAACMFPLRTDGGISLARPTRSVVPGWWRYREMLFEMVAVCLPVSKPVCSGWARGAVGAGIRTAVAVQS